MIYDDLVNVTSSPASRLCAEAVVFAWAEHWLFSAQATYHGASQQTAIEIKRQTAALRRLMMALKTYSQIARL
jgi:hypothetical protein